MTRGVIYYNCGTACAVRLLVSISSLRRYYSGPITLLSDGIDSHPLCEQIGTAFEADVRRWTPKILAGSNTKYLAKTLCHQASPFETTLYLDSDTLVLGGVDELLEVAEESSFVVAHFAGWRSSGGIVGGRIRKWKAFLPEYIEEALNFGPAINTGVFAFHKEARILRDWSSVALRGREMFIPDEVACQVILPRYPHRIVDGRWNRSCKHDNPRRQDTRIIHYHGRKHCRIELPFGGDKWVAEFEALMKANAASVNEWSPAGDCTLRRYLRSCSLRKMNSVIIPIESAPTAGAAVRASGCLDHTSVETMAHTEPNPSNVTQSEFTENWTNALRENQRAYLDPILNTMTSIRYLELGVFEGMGAIHMLSQYPQLDYTGIDAWSLESAPMVVRDIGSMARVKARAQINIAPFAGRARLIHLYSVLALSRMVDALYGGDDCRFDLIYVDAGHFALDVILESSLCWMLLKPGGVIFWDDYRGQARRRTVKTGVDSFLKCVEGRFEILFSNHQLGVCKTAEALCQAESRKRRGRDT